VANPSKAKGTAFETAVVEYLRAHGFPYAERRAQHGTHDLGDIGGIVGYLLECKATKTIDLADGMNELADEQRNVAHLYGTTPAGVLVVKRRNHPVAAAYTIQTLAQWAHVTADETVDQATNQL
jgi:hypothetical protein